MSVTVLQPEEQALNYRLRTARSVAGRGWHILRRWPVIPALIVFCLVLAAAAGPWIQPHDPLQAKLSETLQPPFWYPEGSTSHLLGTDAIGRDILSRIIAGARTAVLVVAISALTGVTIGTFLGVVAGYAGRNIDEFIMRIVDMWDSLPFLLIALVTVLVFGSSLTVLVVLLALLAWPGAVRLVRAETLSLRRQEYIAFAQVAGASHSRILWRHIVPGVINIVVVTMTLRSGTILLAEAALSFLGAGIPPPTPAWGAMVSEGQNYIATAWWVAAFPGLAIGLIVMSGNFFGDWLRDRLDPRLTQLG